MSAPDLFSEGNDAFVDENYELAIQKYSAAIEQNAFNPEYYIKRAAAQIKLANYKDACTDASVAVDLDPKNYKAHLRKGIAYFHAQDFKAAKESLEKGLECENDNKDLKSWLEKCKSKLPADVSSEAQPTPSIRDENESKPHVPVQIPMPAPAKAKYDWYQTETHVVVSVMIKNSKQEDVYIEYGDQHLSVTVRLPSGNDYSLELDLAHPVSPSQCKTKILSTKIELKIKKLEAIRWSSLETDHNVTKPAVKFPQQNATADPHQYPSSRHVVKDWDKLAAEVAKEDEAEKQEGEAALNQLFQKIYGEGSDEVKQAMNKSFIESGGTVLSTNWAEVGKEKVEVKPPDGMEWKEWEH
ncbi:protein SGT1 homolog [Nematostella vectensis]|uniref:protein SGT1 homolog n=1 Tax=Nematostella vectensis TaxID=45351 RepID=UPI0013906648|nr:protein SGT1 homolog [Nematostella vectensis]